MILSKILGLALIILPCATSWTIKLQVGGIFIIFCWQMGCIFTPLPKPSIAFFEAWGALLWTIAEDHIVLHTDWILTGLCARKLWRLFNKRRKSGTRPHFAKIPPMLESHLGSKVLLGPQFALSKQDFWSFYDHKVLVTQGNIDSGAYLDGWCRFGILLHKAVIHAILQDRGTSHSGHLNISGQVFFWFPECQKAFSICTYFILFYHIYSMVMHFHEETCLSLDCTKTWQTFGSPDPSGARSGGPRRCSDSASAGASCPNHMGLSENVGYIPNKIAI